MTPTPPGLEELKRYLQERHGFDLEHYSRSFLERRLLLRLRHHNVAGYEEYLSVLLKDRREYLDLINTLSVNVTEFFRDAALYQAVAERVLPKIKERNFRNGSRAVKAWSAGCASGQEAYTLAMLLDDYFGAQAPAWACEVHASDIQENFLAEARTGKYPKGKAAQIPASFRKRYVIEDGGHVSMAPRLKKLVNFFKHDLASPPPLESLDLLFCRNVMIYFNGETKEKILRWFHRCLNPDGFLVLGACEIILKADLFQLADSEHKIYHRAAHDA
ncbi:MAG: hypothetical protein A3J74_11110 [Elusimicrobia bacterium RIFCSPHIGHO2_02_FULL_57_9]|nr:MAG: hypothetical protein A3J74_11110 [Elusimicrobia bacterium RIFCSPHIGHO2_02_FULL_57_9]